MLLFRSEELIDEWCRRTALPRGQILTLEQTWELAQAWYGDRMTPEFDGRTVAEAHQIFSRLG